ncbi:MAG TPA: phosphoribosylaminoimidazolesuccinocarboxamide synthase [Bacteroidia bacterium]|nr:phosphoribosylaminoimidazolesuccinocarboxamide synthase [Bacteroidia bacterium]
MNLIEKTNFQFRNQTAYYKGKVREVYTINNTYMVMIATDRISAFDVILPRAIPYKGQVLNQTASYFLNATKAIVPNWFIHSPDENVSIGYKCEPYKIEMVVRGYLAGHAWRTYNSGLRTICGVKMPDGLIENDKLPEPIFTPTTKSAHGHDLDITKEEIISQGIVSAADYEAIENYAGALFTEGSKMANKQGLILVDTKYEFGNHHGTVMLMDEIHTPDSSRYFYLEGFDERQKNNQPQKQLSKEFLRQWLIENNFQGLEGQTVPQMDDDIVNAVTNRYVELYQTITGLTFQHRNYDGALSVMEQKIIAALQSF